MFEAKTQKSSREETIAAARKRQTLVCLTKNNFADGRIAAAAGYAVRTGPPFALD
jgi:hypothetical protein